MVLSPILPLTAAILASNSESGILGKPLLFDMTFNSSFSVDPEAVDLMNFA
jgi:hypothetical protein